MQLFYLDEYGDEGLSPRAILAHPYFIMGAMKIQDTQRLSLCKAVRRLKDQFFPGWQQQDWADSEIKGRYLAQAVRRHSRGLPPHRPIAYRQLTQGRLGQFLDRLFNLIHRFNPVFYFVAIDKGRMVQRYAPGEQSAVGQAYAHLQIRAALLIAEVYGSDEGGLFLADEQHHHESLFRKGEMRRIRVAVESHFPRPADIELVLDKPVWINKGELTVDREICQITDFALYIVGTAITNIHWSASNQWLSRISPYIARHWKTGRPWDGGITLIPRPDRYPAFRS